MPESPAPLVKLFAAVLYAPGAPLAEVVLRLRRRFGAIDHASPAQPFDASDYYAPEMGAGLRRTLLGFAPLVPAEALVQAKHHAAALEDGFRVGGRRCVNIDMGYLDLFKVVLASGKERGHKVYLGRGTWADVTLTYAHGRYEPLPWTFPDFRDGRYEPALLAMRERYKQARRERLLE